MIIWEVLLLLAAISFGGPLFQISDDKISGVLGARGAFGGAAVLPLVIYVYALRQPLRYRGLLWLGVLENAVAALFSVFHLAAGDVEAQAFIVPLIASLIFVVLLLVNMPRGKVELPA